MKFYFCASTFGLYTDDANDNIPDDKVEIDQSYYEELISCAERCQYIAVDDTGYPILKNVDDIPVTPEQNKNIAMQLLQDTDWVNQPDVRDPNNSPHLLNGGEFDTYRLAVRKIAVNPPSGKVVFPTLPVEQWSD